MPSEQKCMKCDKQATHKITKIVDGKVHDIFLCDEHAHAFSPYLKQTQQHQAHLVELLQQILKQQQDLAATTRNEENREPVCPTCGLKFSAYRKTLLLGCGDCYHAFEENLIPDLRRMHGTAAQNPDDDILEEQHTAPEAKNPSETVPAEKIDDTPAEIEAESLEDLQLRLQLTIENEDFQQAARLRDAIRTLENARQKPQTPCAQCGAPMEPKLGPHGPILVCTAYPACRNVSPLQE